MRDGKEGGGQGQVLAVANLKGGSGKSTLAVNLACALAAGGRRVALMDCDPQGSAAAWAETASAAGGHGAAALRVHFEPLERLDAAPGWLDRAAWLRLGRDVLVVDLPGVAAPATAAALMLASVVVVPTPPTAVDIGGTRRALALLAAAARERAPGPPPLALLVPVRVRDGEEEGGPEGWRARLAGLSLPATPPIGLRPEFEAAFARGAWVGGAFPGSAAARELGEVTARVVLELGLAAAAGRARMPSRDLGEAPWWRWLVSRLAAGGRPWRLGAEAA